MKAAVRTRFGPPEVIAIEEVGEPRLTPDGVLVRVRAASPNRADVYAMLGTPLVARVETGLRRPKNPRLGGDFAGTVEAVGSEVDDFRPGDDVFGGKLGAFAERLAVTGTVAHKPAELGFEAAATLPTAGITALQALRDRGRLRAGERVLVNGASGGVGTFAVQIAKALGATVTAVCSSANVNQALRLGADTVVDYTLEDVTRGRDRFDLVVDVAGSHPWSHLRRVLAPGARVVVVGGPSEGALLGPLGHIAGMKIASLASAATASFFIASFNRPDFETLARMAVAGEITPLVETTYPLSRTADAMRHMLGHVRSKIVITVP